MGVSLPSPLVERGNGERRPKVGSEPRGEVKKGADKEIE
jgi:hypothetical protein